MKIGDIAKLAGVSKSAVSLALNGKSGISEETRQRILEIVRQHDYIPRSIVNASQVYGSSMALRLIACVKTEVVSHRYASTSFFSELVHGIEKQCREEGYALIYSTIAGKNFESEIYSMEKEYTSRGSILLGTNLDEAEIKVFRDSIPNLVVIDNCYDYLDCNFVVMNNTTGAYNAANYLLELGHRKIGYIQSRTRVHNFDLRKKGFYTAIKNKDMSFCDNDITVGPEIEQAQKDFTEFLTSIDHKDLPSALFCESDYMAIGVIKALQQTGIKVPGDISVMGFDNVTQSTVLSPELTTIHVEKELMGVKAVKRLSEIIGKKDNATVKTIINTKLVIRNSCDILSPQK